MATFAVFSSSARLLQFALEACAPIWDGCYRQTHCEKFPLLSKPLHNSNLYLRVLINNDIGPSPNLGWVGTVWILGSAVGFLLVGRLSDIFGRKWMVIGTTVLSIIGNIVGAMAHSIETLIAANACNGVAAAGQLSFGIVLGELVPNKQRGPIVTLVFMSSLPFAVFGPIIARKFIDSTVAGWRWSYYLGIILGVITIVLYQFLYHPPTYSQLHVNGKTKWQAFKELDFIGIFLYIAGCVLFLIGLSWGGQVYSWTSAPVLCTIIIGILTLVAFGLYGKSPPSSCV
jgi:MFS family permease